MPKKKYNNYDNTLFGRYIRQIENPDSIGWDSSSRIWRQSTRKGDDERNRGMGIDVLNNKAAKKLTQDRVGGFLTEEEERQLRNEYLQEMLNVIDRQKAKHPGLNNMSPRKQAEVIGALYRGDAPKLWDKSTILGKALESPNEEDFHRAIDTYYNSVGLGERARNNDKFWSNQTHSNQSPHVPSPTITRQIDGMVFPTMPSSQPTITKQDVVDAAMLGPKVVAAGVGTVANYINQAVQKYIKPKDNSKDNTVRWAEGGFLNPKDAWDALSMKDKADMIGIAVKHGITTLSDIRDKYNEFAEGGGMEESMNTIPEDYAPLASPIWQPIIDKMKQDSYKSNVEDFAYRVQKMHPEITQQQVEEAYKSVPIIASDSRRGRETGKYVYGDESGYGQRIMLYPNRMKEDQGVGGLTREDQLRNAMGHEANHLYVHTLLGGNYTDEEKALLDAAYPDDLFHVPEGGNIYDEKRAYNMQVRKALSEAYGNLVGADYDKATEKMKPDDVMWNYSQLGTGYMSDYQKVKQKYKKGSKWDQKQVDAILKATKDVAYTPTVNPYEYEEGVNYAALGGPLIENVMNEYKNGGYKPSENIKKRISRWEGDAMVRDTIDPLSGKMAKKNRPFEEVTRGFVGAIPSEIREQVFSNPELADNLFSYAYNVGPGNFKKRVVPVLQRYYNGDATVDDVTSSMWASGDKKLRGLRNRRAEEKAGVRNALLGHAATSTILEPTTPAIVATNNYVSSPYPLLTEEVQPTPLFYHIEDRSTDISPSPEELERQERREALNRFNTVMTLIGIKNPLAFYTSNTGNSFLDTLGLFANESANGGKIHIKPENRGKFTALKERTGHSATWFKEHGTPAQKKMAVFALNSRKWKHGDGGNLFDEDANIYGLGDWLKKGINKSRRVVSSLGLDKSPAQHFIEWVTSDDNNKKQDSKITMKPEENNNLGFWSKNAIAAARALGLNDRYKGEEEDTLYRRNIFNQIDPTTNVPRSIGEMLEFARTAERAKSKEQLPYIRKYQNPSAEAAWAKRLGLPYDSTLLISNSDGSVHLSKQLEDEMPTDTILLKNRIASNEKKLNNIYGPHKKVIEAALDFDRGTLSALRETYKTGKPVTIDEHSYNTRDWRGKKPEDITPTPLSLLHRYTFQYDRDNNAMNYWDTYNFDEYEDFVPGKPFFIKGSIDLNKRK